MNSFDEVFVAVKDFCRERVAAATYNVFIDSVSPVSFENGVATLSVASDFLRGVIQERYVELFREAFNTIFGFEVQVCIESRAAQEPSPAQPTFAQNAQPVQAQPTTLSGGNYDFTFENFIVGSTNRFAHAAAQAVAANPSGAYNPLFIYGGSGLGKTHLLNAIQLEVKRMHPEYNIVFVDGEKFTNEIITAIQENKTAAFHTKYRAADILLVDDIQFIAGKESTQEEFFHTFNTLFNAGKQIVLVSDRPPKEIKSLEERLRTRFEWGLTADVQPPDFEMRVAIIRRKAALLNFDMPDDVAEYIANRLKNNIRQLEGAVKKLNAKKMLEGIAPVIAVAQNTIKDILSETQPVPITIDKIISEVARTYNIAPSEIRGRKRNAVISNARKVSMYVVREITGMSMEEIGNEFGGRDHSTVVYSIAEVEKKRLADNRSNEMVEDIIKNIRS